MRVETLATATLAVGIAAFGLLGIYLAIGISKDFKELHSHDGELNWAQDALRDPAQDGCPSQYHEYANINHVPVLIGCWGHRDQTPQE